MIEEWIECCVIHDEFVIKWKVRMFSEAFAFPFLSFNQNFVDKKSDKSFTHRYIYIM